MGQPNIINGGKKTKGKPLKLCTVNELKEKAKSKGLSGYSKLNKSELIMSRAYWIDKVSKTDLKDENLFWIHRKIMKNPHYGMNNDKDYLFDVPTILNNYETFERITGITLIDDEDYEPDPPLVRIEQFILRSLNDHEKAAFQEKINEYTNRYILDEFSPELLNAFDDYKTDANYHSYDSYPFDEKERIFHEFLECLDD